MNPLPKEKAKVIANVAQTIINSASVENQYLKIVGGSQGSGFIEEGRMENIKTLNEKN
jgi:UDP-N-acetylglucosamine:LPS N-acetylglucosamine transferase